MCSEGPYAVRTKNVSVFSEQEMRPFCSSPGGKQHQGLCWRFACSRLSKYAWSAKFFSLLFYSPVMNSTWNLETLLVKVQVAMLWHSVLNRVRTSKALIIIDSGSSIHVCGIYERLLRHFACLLSLFTVSRLAFYYCACCRNAWKVSLRSGLRCVRMSDGQTAGEKNRSTKSLSGVHCEETNFTLREGSVI